MTGAELIDSTLYEVGKVQTVATDTNFRLIVLNWLNRVKNDICGRTPHWTWLEKTSTFDTVESQMSYDLPADCDLSGRKIISLKQTESPQKLIYIDQRRLDELEPNPTESTGVPTHYTMFDSYLRLYPVPDSVITMTLRYLKDKATDYADDAETSDIPTKWDEVLIDGILVHAFRYQVNWGDSTQQKQVYEAGVLRMVRDNANVVDDNFVSESHAFGPSSSELRPPYSFNRMDVG